MYADPRGHQATRFAETPFEAHARHALRAAIVTYGWDHPVVSAAERSLRAIRRTGCR